MRLPWLQMVCFCDNNWWPETDCRSTPTTEDGGSPDDFPLPFACPADFAFAAEVTVIEVHHLIRVFCHQSVRHRNGPAVTRCKRGLKSSLDAHRNPRQILLLCKQKVFFPTPSSGVRRCGSLQ